MQTFYTHANYYFQEIVLLRSKLELDMSNLPIYAPDYMNNLKLLLLNEIF